MEKEKVNLALYNTVMHGIFLKRHPVKAFFKFFQHMAFFKCRSTVIFFVLFDFKSFKSVIFISKAQQKYRYN